MKVATFNINGIKARINALPEAHRPFALAIYANAVVSKMDRAEEQAEPVQYPC